MKYIKPPEFKSVREFTEYYKKIETQITKLLESDASARTSEELNKKIQDALSAAISYLTKVNKRFTEKELPKAFKEGKDSVKEPIKLSKEEASEILKKQGFKYAKKAFSRDTYIELQSAVKSAGEGLKERINGIIETLKTENKDSVYNVRQAIAEELRKNGLLTVEYKNGAKQPLESYAAMAARSARIESINIGAIGRALQTGTDYVKMTTVPQCCKFCGAYQDKVYCVSGKDKRFPALFQTVLKSGYALPHPNCRHEFIPWYPDMESPEDVEQAIKDSKIKYNKDGSLVDVRYQKDIEAYANWQRGNRQRNAEQLEFQKMQAYYAEKDVDAPYKTIGAFRRARRANNLSPAYKAWRNRKIDENVLERWKGIENFRNCPKTLEELQEIKYNNKDEWELLKREKKTVIDINSKAWTESFKKKAIDTYYDFRKSGIELTDHGVARLLQRVPDTEKIKEICQKPFNYVQENGKYIKFYDGIAVVYTSNRKEITSVVPRKHPKGEWNEI